MKRPLLKRLRLRLALKIAGGIVGVLILTLIVVNLIVSADWVQDRVAARVKEQTGRDLNVDGSTSLLFTPSPHIVITDATFTDPGRAGADISVARIAIDLNFDQLLGREMEVERVVLDRPVLTLRPGRGNTLMRRSDTTEKPKPTRFGELARRYIFAGAGGESVRRELKLKDVRIEDGTVNILYDDNGRKKRVQRIYAKLSLPSPASKLIGRGKLEWKEQTVDFSFDLNSPAILREKQPARLVFAVVTPALEARFEGKVSTAPHFSGQGEIAAKAHSIPSVLAWMRERPEASAAIGDGELASDVTWNDREIVISDARFALEHASGQGRAVVTLARPRPHVRAALALDHLDLNPFLSNDKVRSAANPGGKASNATEQARSGRQAAKAPEDDGPVPPPDAPKDWFSKPRASEGAPAVAMPLAQSGAAPSADPRTPAVTGSVPASAPAGFDADLNLNVRKTRIGHLDIGPSSLGVAFRDGVLNATLGGMELYEGHARGKFTIDAARPVPAFSGDFQLEGVEAKALLSDAAQFSMISGRAKLDLALSGEGVDTEHIKSSLRGHGNLMVSDGTIEGIDITEFLDALGEGEMPKLRQGPGAQTAFSDLGGGFIITNGIAETNNLQVMSTRLKVTAAGSVDLTASTIDMLARPEILDAPKGKRANKLAGLSVPVRIRGPLDDPRIKPEIGQMLADPESASKTVNQIGEVLQKKFKGKPVGETLGRFLGNVQIGTEREKPPAEVPDRPKPPKSTQGEPPPAAAGKAEPEQGDSDEPITDPDLQEILR
ncbi:MAG: AsmA family protein [Methyloceanibacter sp.]